MALHVAADRGSLEGALAESASLVVGFFGSFSEAATRGRATFERWCAKHPEVEAWVVDVGEVKGVHRALGVDAVPTIVVVRAGKPERSIVGVQPEEYLDGALLGVGSPSSPAAGKREHRVTVFVTDSCPWCTRVKSYLREKHVQFAEVNVQRDQSALRKMVARSGQQGVPQLDIDGSFVVGFDKPRIDALLGIARSA